MHDFTLDRTPSWLTRRARDGVDLLALSKPDGDTSAVRTVDASRQRWRACADGEACLSIQRTLTHGQRTGLLPRRQGGGWTRADLLDGHDGWTCYVEQHRYGHAAKKATWLYAHGIELPALRWGYIADQECAAPVSWCGNRVKKGERRPRVGKRQAEATPPEFRDALIAMARTAVKS